jgi:hypothetical protein
MSHRNLHRYSNHRLFSVETHEKRAASRTSHKELNHCIIEGI